MPSPTLPRPPSSHLVISGSGRAGTSFLMALMTRLGLDTGFSQAQVDRELARPAHAGLEHDLLKPGPLPYIVKNPKLCDDLAEVLARGERRVDHLIVPMRDVDQAAQSRYRAQRGELARLPWPKRWLAWLKRKPMAGGLLRGARFRPQAPVLLERVHRLLLTAAAHELPVTLLAYPRLVQDPAYLYRHLAPHLGGIGWAQFHQAHQALVRPDWVHAPGHSSPAAAALTAPLLTAQAPAVPVPGLSGRRFA